MLPRDLWIQGLANLSAAFLLTGILCLLLTATALAWLSAKALMVTRQEVQVLAPRFLAWLLSFQLRLETEAQTRLFRPQVALLSGWRGVRAGAAALLHGTREPRA